MQANPTYHDLGDHTEAIQVEFDPAIIRYEELLQVFWQEHSGTREAWSVQYAAFVFAHDADQERLAQESRTQRGNNLGKTITTRVKPLTRFWRAEDYHQKYRLRHRTDLASGLIAHYGGDRAFVDSTAAARLNGLLAGYGERAIVAAELERLALPAVLLNAIP